MHVLLATVPTQGHTHPTVPLTRELRARGHRVTCAAPERLRPDIEAAGGELLATTEAEPLTEFFERDAPDVLCYDVQAVAASMTADRFQVPRVALNTVSFLRKADGRPDPLCSVPHTAGERPLLFVSVGEFLCDTKKFLRMCFEAFAGTGWQVALAAGEHAGCVELGPAPANFEVRPRFPRRSTLRQADVFVSHADPKSVRQSLAAGVPLVTVPRRPEERFTARTVALQGLGLALEPETLTARALREAVDTVHTSTRIRTGVTALRDELRAGVPAAQQAADLIEHHLADLAQSA